MENPFSISEEKLGILLDAYMEWCEKNEEDRDYAKTEQEKSKSRKETLLNKKHLNGLTEVDFADEISAFSKTLEGPAQIHLGKQRISEEQKNIKRNLLYLIESSKDPFKKSAEILEGKYQISRIAKAFWTPLFQAQYPEQLPNWNSKTENFLKKFGIDIRTSTLPIQQRYEALSDAFKFLKSIRLNQNFFTINHLMHYGTVVDEGVKKIEELIDGIYDPNDLALEIRKFRKVHTFQKRIDARIESEEKAKTLLRSKLGKFKENDLRSFFRELNHDYWDGKEKYGRFSMAYTGSNLKALVNQLPKVNLWLRRFWEVDEDSLEDLLDEYFDTKPIKNAGTAFPSIILYLLDPQKYNLCFPKMVQRLSKFSDFVTQNYSGSFYYYYNDKMNELKKQHSLLPQEMDVILTGLELNGRSPNPDYDISKCSAETNLSIDLLTKWKRALERKGQAIIYGPPGTGKTFVAEKLAKHLTAGTDGFTDLVQFHPAYTYEDFMQGLRPKARENGGLDYPLVQGRFLDFCEKAKSKKSKCVLIIDEINRANLARVFGELMYLLEYRGQEVPLASGGKFLIPGNVRIIGTMNTADRSIALVDHALRRRFVFLALYPDYEIMKKYHKDIGTNVDNLIGLLQKLNKQIGDTHYEVGISYFLRSDLDLHLADIWQMEIEPYLEEFFFDQPDIIDEFRWEKIGPGLL